MNNNKYFLEVLKTFLQYNVDDFEKAIEELKSNPTYYFTWRAEDIIKSGYKKQWYERLILKSDDQRDIRIDIIRLIRYLIMLDVNFRVSRSTCMFQMQEDIILRETRIELIEQLESLLTQY